MKELEAYKKYFRKMQIQLETHGDLIMLKDSERPTIYFKETDYGIYLEGIFRLTNEALKKKKEFYEFQSKLNENAKICNYSLKSNRLLAVYWLPFRLEYSAFQIVIEVFYYDISLNMSKVLNIKKFLY